MKGGGWGEGVGMGRGFGGDVEVLAASIDWPIFPPYFLSDEAFKRIIPSASRTSLTAY